MCSSEMATIPEEREQLLQLAIEFAISSTYPPHLEDKKRAIHRKAAALTIEKGEVFLQRQQRRAKAVTTKQEQKRILDTCHSGACIQL